LFTEITILNKGVFLGMLLLPSPDRTVIYLGVLCGATCLFGFTAAWTLPSVSIQSLLLFDLINEKKKSQLSDVRDFEESHSHFEASESVGDSLRKLNFWLATMFIAIWSMKNSFYLASFSSSVFLECFLSLS
jgi:hypothetical protein